MRKIQSNKKIKQNIKKFIEMKRNLESVDTDAFCQVSAFMAGILFHIDHESEATDLAFAFDEMEDYHLHHELIITLITERIFYGTEGSDIDNVVDKLLEEHNIKYESDDEDDI